MTDLEQTNQIEVYRPEGFDDLSIIGWVILNKATKHPLVTGGSYSGQTSKFYSTAGRAKAAFANSSKKKWHSLYYVVPVYFPQF